MIKRLGNLLLLLVTAVVAGGAPLKQDLAGPWRFALDARDEGYTQQWFSRELSDHIQLPGILQAQDFGNLISTNTPWVLSLYDKHWYQRRDYTNNTRPGQVRVPFVAQPPRHYLGFAWYQRSISIPPEWADKRLVLHLERARWSTAVWVDGRPFGTNVSLCTPHEFDLGKLPPGSHRLTICVDNRMLMDYRPDAHSVSDSLGQSWNGITGAIELRATSPVWIQSAQVFPDLAKKNALVKVRLGNTTGKPGRGSLRLEPGGPVLPIDWDTNGGQYEITLDLGPNAELWDEFHPVLHRRTLRLEGQGTDSRELVFGLQRFSAQGNQFAINGRPVHLRGTHHGGDFPLTGYPPADVTYWKRIFATCKEWGLNHVRFHSFCPPEAAFVVADELGIYLQPEPGMWNTISPGSAMERILYQETERMLETYGNHPSFVLCSASNEPKGNWKTSLPRWVDHFRSRDARRLYTTGTGWSLIDEPGPVTGADYLAVHRIGRNLLRGNTAWFGRDYAASLRGVNVPVASHELGQWCAYPDFSVVRKFTGYLRPGNYEIFRESAARHGLLEANAALAFASGRFQLACYKEEIEANLRTPGLGGFQLLDLHDYLGQGTALVGLLDPFWESKGYATASEFTRFCAPTVPLARLRQRVFTSADTLEVPVEISHYGPADLPSAELKWELRSASATPVAHGTFGPLRLPTGTNTPAGRIKLSLSSCPAPQALQLVASVVADGRVCASNDWALWVYPPGTNAPVPGEVVVTSDWANARTRLAAGARVLFLPEPSQLDWFSPPLDTLPVFWNRLMNPGWSRMLGLWCDTNHAALAKFPTTASGDWQWIEIVRRSRAMNLDSLPSGLRPIVQAVDDWNRNYKLGLLFECQVGNGRLVVCSIDFRPGSPGALQLQRSVLDYMNSAAFRPSVAILPGQLESLFFDTTIMARLGAKSSAEAAIDGDPNTYWQAGGRDRQHPHTLTVEFPREIAMSGLHLMPRQNHRDHEGDIREYRVEASNDGTNWTGIAHGTLDSTFDPQDIPFATTITNRMLRFIALSGFGTDTTAALGELAIRYAGPPLNPASAPVNYRRIRSSSSDIDEGN